MEIFLSIVHYGLCLVLVVIILLQAGKGADIGAAFGAGGSQTLFGPRGAATFLSKLTAVLSFAFLTTSLILSSMSGERASQSVFDKVAPAAETQPSETAPAETLPSP